MILTVTPNPCVHNIVTFRGDPGERIVVRPVESRFQAGGKGINAARAACAFGGEVLALLTHGGEVGRILLDGLRREGVPTAGVEVAAGTRMSTFVHGTDTGQFREYLEEGGPVSGDEQTRFRELYERLLPDAELVALAGSVPKDSFGGFYCFAVERARAAGKRVLVDTYGGHTADVAACAPDLFKANLDEVRGSFGVAVDQPVELEQFVRRMLDLGIGHLLLTAGAAGAWLCSPEQVLRIESPSVREVNPVGSGDAMLGGLLSALAEGGDLASAVARGAAAGAANAARIGCCDFHRDAVDRLLPAVRVERLEPGEAFSSLRA